MKIICQTTLFFLVFVTNSFAQVGIGTTTPDASSALDVTATNKGLLVPRVALTGCADTATVASPATSLLVYNNATAGTSPNNVTPGYYYFNGTKWERLTNGGANSIGAFTTATANGATITNGVLQLAPASVDYGGIVNTDAQTFSGTKTFNKDAFVNGLTMGRGAGNKDTNTTIGFEALNTNTTGQYNAVVGYNSLKNNNGNSNSAFGFSVLSANTSGYSNNAFGSNSLVSNLGGYDNSAFGTSALGLNTGGYSNVGIGAGAGLNNKTGYNNTFLGTGSKPFSDNLNNAIAIGYNAVVNASNTIQLGNASVTNVNTSGLLKTGAVAYPNTHGSAGQVLSTTGVADSTLTWVTPVAGPSIGAFTTATANGATITDGVLQLAPASVDYGGIVNTDAQTFSGTKTFNVDAIVNGLTVGRGTNSVLTNSAFGVSALAANTSGVQNNAIGNSALSANTTGQNNNANGANALKANTSGLQNNALGTRALELNTVSNYNIAIGQLALAKNNGIGGLIANGVQPDNSGNANIAIGSLALSENTNGHSNVGIGHYVLIDNTNLNASGNYVSALGYWAGKNNYNGSYNTYLGAKTSASNPANFSNSTALGYGASISGSNTIQLGNSDILNVKTFGSITAGNVTYPNTHNNITGQVLTTNGAGVAGWTNPTSGGTVTNVSALTIGTTGTNINSSVATGTTTPVITLNVPDASASARGVVTIGAQTFAGAKTFSSPITSTVATGTAPFTVTSTTPVANLSIGGNAATATTATNATNSAITNDVASNATVYPVWVTANGGNLPLKVSDTKFSFNPLNGRITTSGDATINGVTIGKGNGNVESNTAIGVSAGALNASGTDNVSIGYNAGPSATFNNTISIGSGARASAANTMQLGNTSLSTINSSAKTLTIGDGTPLATATSLNINAGATGASSIEVGNGRTGDGVSYIDLHSSSGTDYDARILRNAGQNASWDFIQFRAEPIKFFVSGSLSAEIRNGGQIWSQNGYAQGSDKRIKKNIVTTKYGLNTIMQMRPVDYDLKLNDKKQVGFIAQEVKELVPELVDGFEGDVSKGEILSLNYIGITPILTKAIQEQQKEIDSLKAEIETLKALFAKEISKK
jgi:hypothetical protein